MTPGTNLTLPKDLPRFAFVNLHSQAAPFHVLTLTPFFPSSSNPVYGTYVSEPIQHFAEFNLRSTVIGISPLHHQRRRPLPSAPAEWLRYPQIPGNVGLTSAGFLLYRRLLPFLRRLHQRNAIDIIHAHSALPCGHAAFLLAQRLRVPFVVTIHGLDVFNACFAAGTIAAKRRAQLSADVYGRAASVICISRRIQNILNEGMPQPARSCVVYNGTDPQLFYPEPTPAPERPLNVLMVGNLLRGKGHEIVLRAMAQVSAQFPGLQCTMIGEGPDQSRFAELARTLGLAEKVSFPGRQGRFQVAKAMRECTLFALPSWFEGLGCAYLEAMASAKPVIACEGQGIGEIIRHGENGWLIPIDGVKEMAEALVRLLGSSELRTRIGNNARQTILNGLTMTDQVSQLSDVYRDGTKP